MKYILFVILQTILTIGLTGQNDDIEIKAIIANRKLSNLALKEHRIEEVIQHLINDVVILTASGRLITGRDSLESFLTYNFEQNDDMYFVRETMNVFLNESKDMAWEEGMWTGLRPKTSNWKNIEGKYAAVWVKTDNIWKMRSQQFIRLK